MIRERRERWKAVRIERRRRFVAVVCPFGRVLGEKSVSDLVRETDTLSTLLKESLSEEKCLR